MSNIVSLKPFITTELFDSLCALTRKQHIDYVYFLLDQKDHGFDLGGFKTIADVEAAQLAGETRSRNIADAEACQTRNRNRNDADAWQLRQTGGTH